MEKLKVKAEENKVESGAGNSYQSSRKVQAADLRKMTVNPTAEVFQLLVKARNAEKKEEAEGKRQEGLRQIQGMRSKTGIDPLALFPKEIWALILDLLKNPADLGNLFHLHPVFRDLLETNWIRDFLFPQVLDYKINLCQKPCSPFAIPRSKSKEDLKILLILRQVSRSLRDAVDRWVEDDILERMRRSSSSSSVNSVHLQLTDDIQELNRILFFCDVSKPKRFFLRSLKVTLCLNDLTRKYTTSAEQLEARRRAPEIFALFQKNLTELLKSVGDQILHFHLDIAGQLDLIRCGVPLGRSQIEYLIRQWLLLMPNLKWLDLFSYGQNWMGNASYLQMPTLPHLERVDQWNFESLLLSSIKAVLEANPHVKYHLRRASASKYAHPTVKTLALEAAEIEECNIPSLQLISNENNWNLKRMSLEMALRKDGQYSMAQVFRCLEKFPTLEDLSLQINHVAIEKDINILQLPSLKNLKITFGPHGSFLKCNEGSKIFFSLQFLLHCGKLESLIWENLKMDSQNIHRKMEGLKRSETVIDFKGGFGDLTGSNVWDVFPRLKCIYVKFRLGAKQAEREYVIREYHKRNLVKESKKNWSESKIKWNLRL